MNKDLYVMLLQGMTDDEFVKFMNLPPKTQEDVYRLWVRKMEDLVRHDKEECPI